MNTASAVVIASMISAGTAAAESFKGYQCSSDCSGHRAGYNWAQQKGLNTNSECPLVGRRQSFYEGCLAFVQERVPGQPSRPTSQPASDPKIKVITQMPGTCRRFTINNSPTSCQSVTYLYFPNGRSSFLVAHSGGTIAFSGGKDSQIISTRYTLEVDAIRVTYGGTNVQSYDAKGRCEMNSSESGEYVHSVVCEASNNVEKVSLNFRGDGSKVKVLRFD